MGQKLLEKKALLALPISQESLRYDRKHLKKWLDSFKNLYGQLDLECKREILRHYIKKIEIHSKKKGRIVYDPAALMKTGPKTAGPAYEEFRPEAVAWDPQCPSQKPWKPIKKHSKSPFLGWKSGKNRSNCIFPAAYPY